jgi:multiple sugar transport system substrate-binding protein
MKKSGYMKVLVTVLVLFMLAPVALFASGASETASEKITLEFWMPGQEPTIRDTMLGLIGEFQTANPEITVNYSQIPWSEYFTKLTAAIAGGMVPDIFGAGWGQFGMLVTKNTFAEIPGGAQYDLADIQSWAIDAGSYKGKLYGLVLPETRPLAYRTDHFLEAGLDPNKPPTNWAELQQYAEKLTVRENGRVVRPGIDIPYLGTNEQVFLTFYAQKKEGANLWEEGGKPAFYTPEGIATLQYLVDLKNKYNVLIPSDQQALMGTAFSSGVASMGFPQSQSLPQLLQARPNDLAFANPTKEADNKAFVGGTFICVAQNSKAKEAAFKLQAFLYSKESMWKIYKGILFLPTRESLQTQFLGDAPHNEVLAFSLRNSVFYPVNPNFGEARSILAAEIEQAFYGNKTPEKALKDAHDAMMKLYERDN